jgi:hypothetical protein
MCIRSSADAVSSGELAPSDATSPSFRLVEIHGVLRSRPPIIDEPLVRLKLCHSVRDAGVVQFRVRAVGSP